jgi:hypothetical protein
LGQADREGKEKAGYKPMNKKGKHFPLLVLFIFFGGTNLSAQNDRWKVEEIVDTFGDKTGDRRLVYYTSGTFSNSATRDSHLDVLLYVNSPSWVSISVFEYGRYIINLDDTLFSYKTETIKIEHVPLQGEYTTRSLFNGKFERDETTSLIYLLKQGGLIQFRAYKNGSAYQFNVNADNFLNLLLEIFGNEKSS